MNETYLFTHLDSFFLRRNQHHHATLKFERKKVIYICIEHWNFVDLERNH